MANVLNIFQIYRAGSSFEAMRRAVRGFDEFLIRFSMCLLERQKRRSNSLDMLLRFNGKGFAELFQELFLIQHAVSPGKLLFMCYSLYTSINDLSLLPESLMDAATCSRFRAASAFCALAVFTLFIAELI